MSAACTTNTCHVRTTCCLACNQRAPKELVQGRQIAASTALRPRRAQRGKLQSLYQQQTECHSSGGPARLARRSARRQARWPHVFTPAAQGGSVLTPATSSFNAANDTEQFVCSLAQQQACLCLLVKFPVCRQWVSHATVTDEPIRLKEDPLATTVLRHHITTIYYVQSRLRRGRRLGASVQHTVQCWAVARRRRWDGWPRAPQPTSRPPTGRGATNCGRCADTQIFQHCLNCFKY